MKESFYKDVASIFPHPEKVDHILKELVVNPFSGSEFLELWLRIRSYFQGSADPAALLRQFSRVSQMSFNPSSFYKNMAQLQPYREIVFAILENSLYFTDILVRHPEYLPWLVTEGVNRCFEDSEEPLAELQETAARLEDSQRFIRRVKAYKRREILRIGTKDLLHLESFQNIVREISFLAEAVLQVVLQHLEEQFVRRYGPSQTGFCVIALGKLGGTELNYSSDVDVMFLYEEEGEIPGSGMSNHEYFNRLAEQYVQVLTRIEQGDCLYRIDPRLRPDGDSGPLARSLISMLRYYEIRGKAWEKQMLIKARPVAGDLELGTTFLRRIEPFVYPKTILENPLLETRRMKAEIEAQLSLRQNGGQNVKLMAGGIRDVEFLVQALHPGFTRQHDKACDPLHDFVQVLCLDNHAPK